MRVSLNWLREFVDIEVSPEDLAHQMTMLGMEIESIDRPGEDISNVYIGRILEIRPHPNADKLVVCRTDVGRGEPLQIVCGARNMQEGDLVPTAVVGARLPGGVEIGRRKMRGLESQGMMCSAKELGLGKDHEGLLILPQSLAIGADAKQLLGLDDVIFEIEVTPNRGDWASMLGVARELAAFYGRPLRVPDIHLRESEQPVDRLSSVTINDPIRCRRYIGRVISDIGSAATPLWMAQRLAFAGQRTVNAVVDITNYVLLETGHPLHAFDFDRLEENRIVVRRARNGEVIRTIDGERRSLRDDMLVIADAANPVAIAGIMGGMDSEVGESTRTVFLESAWFDPSSVRRTARSLGMNTEASTRFQRGADPEMAAFAADRAAQLIAEICGGVVAAGVLDEYPNPIPLAEVTLRHERTNKLLGIRIPIDRQRSILEQLRFSICEVNDSQCVVRVPSWRHDVGQEADLIEEIARLYGFDNITASIPVVHKSEVVLAPEELVIRKLRRYLVGLGLTEMMCLTFSSSDALRKAGLDEQTAQMVRLQNPLSSNSSGMRTTMLTSMLEAVSLNIRRGRQRVCAFELGHVYHDEKGLECPIEKPRLGIVLSGLRHEPHWGMEKVSFDIFDIKGIFEAVADFFGADPIWETDPFGVFEEKYSGIAKIESGPIGRFGAVKQSILHPLEVDQPVFLAEVFLENLVTLPKKTRAFLAPSQYPPSRRDMALLVDTAITAGEILNAAKAAGGDILKSATIFDVYAGDRIPSGKKSVGLAFQFQSDARTLTDKDTQQAWDRIYRTLTERYHVELR